ncbi:MAG: hypothetical protein WKG07_33555 [Hymenobacter sp.]
MAVLSGRTYQVAVSKDGKNIETQEFAVPVSTNDSTTIAEELLRGLHRHDRARVCGASKTSTSTTDKYKLRPESITELNNIASVLKANARHEHLGGRPLRLAQHRRVQHGAGHRTAPMPPQTTSKKQGVAETRLAHGELRRASPGCSQRFAREHAAQPPRRVPGGAEGRRNSNAGVDGRAPVPPAAGSTTMIAYRCAPAPPLPRQEQSDEWPTAPR